MTSRRSLQRFRPHLLASALLLALTAQAQVSTATLKGQVLAAAGARQAGQPLLAVNVANGAVHRTTVTADGSYQLLGLPPGTYELRIGGVKTETITLQVGENAVLDLRLATSGTEQRLATVVVQGNASRKGVRDSQVGTHVSQRLIEAMPQTTRNFLSSADLAPGVAFVSDGAGNTRVQSGAQNHDHVNVFIDGVGQKNNILRGGLTGQDSSRGNPFPQSAIAEYKVLTQNYKAEFEQVSSAAITAVTKSGTNEWRGGAYVDRTGTNWRDKTPFEKEREAAGVPLPPSEKFEYGFSVGGPVVKDRTHVFFAYDGKRIEDSRQVLPRNLDKFGNANAGILPSLRAMAGSHVDQFTEHLLFGKLDTQLSEDSRLSVSLRLRKESDHVAENRDLSAPGNDMDRQQDELRFDLKHEWSRDAWLSEARVGIERFKWNPQSAATTPLLRYKVSTANPQDIDAAQDVIFAGGSPDAQNRQQRGSYVSEDLTWTGLAGHVIKGGIKLKAMKYDLSGTSRSVDDVDVLIDTVSGNPFFDGRNCTGTNIINNGGESDQCRIRRALAPASVNFSNQQLGLYLQDDWSVTPHLEFSLGLRWDRESNMLNNKYATPADRLVGFDQPDLRDVGGIKAPAGQTYRQSLAKGGINIADYISTGSSRKVFNKALAPRLGFSLDLSGNRDTVLFGGWGRSYDRAMANHALDELQKNAQPNGETWMIRNDVKMPFADQLSFGVRQALGGWNAEVALSRVHAKNQFVWFHGNRDPNGGYGTQSPIDPLWGPGQPGVNALILGDTVGENRTDALFVKLDKPYSSKSGWTASVAYTYTDAKTLHREWNNDIFDWNYGRPGVRAFNPSTLVDKHRIVAAFMSDQLLPAGLAFSAKATWASGMPRRVVSCGDGWNLCRAVAVDAWDEFSQVDLALSKELRFAEHALTLRLDVLNAFGSTNYGGFDDWGGGPTNGQKNIVGGDNLNLGKPNAMRGDPRTYRLVLNYKF